MANKAAFDRMGLTPPRYEIMPQGSAKDRDRASGRYWSGHIRCRLLLWRGRSFDRMMCRVGVNSVDVGGDGGGGDQGCDGMSGSVDRGCAKQGVVMAGGGERVHDFVLRPTKKEKLY